MRIAIMECRVGEKESVGVVLTGMWWSVGDEVLVEWWWKGFCGVLVKGTLIKYEKHCL